MHANVRMMVAAMAAAALLSIPTSAVAQTTAPSSDPSFLVSGMAQSGSQHHAQGFGFGVKGGLLYSSYRETGESFKNNNGWEAGIFFGGNRSGAIGVMGEVLYAKKGAKYDAGVLDVTVDSYYLEIPLMLRVNIGSSNRNSGAIVYAIGGPVADILLKSELNGVDVKSGYESLDLGVIGGAGVEISRVIVEARVNWGLKNVAKANGGSASDIKTRSFAVLAGLRFN